MAKLDTKARAALPGRAFAGPDRSFPIPDKSHARAALSMVGRSEKAGHISASGAAKVRAAAERKLGKGKK